MFYSPRHLKSLILCRAHVFGGEVGLSPVPPPLTWQPAPEMNEQATVTGTFCSRWALQSWSTLPTQLAVRNHQVQAIADFQITEMQKPEHIFTWDISFLMIILSNNFCLTIFWNGVYYGKKLLSLVKSFTILFARVSVQDTWQIHISASALKGSVTLYLLWLSSPNQLTGNWCKV